MAQGEVTLTDGSRLYRAAGVRREQPRDEGELREVLLRARREGRRVAVKGAGWSQGGLWLCEGGVLIDTAGLDRVLEIDTAAGLARVQAGVTWDQLRAALGPLGWSTCANQSYGLFSIGGSISVNAHGRNVDSGVLAASVVSLRVMLADGSLVEASRQQHAELFRLVLGGLGLFGVVVDATLRLAPDDTYVKSSLSVMPAAEYPRHFLSRVRPDRDVHFHYARLSVELGEVWRRLFCIDYRVDREGAPADGAIRAPRDLRLQRLMLWANRRFRWARRIRFAAELAYRARPERVRRNSVAAESMKAIERQAGGRRDWLQEFFIPAGRLGEFLAKGAAILEQERFQLLNTTIRYVPQNLDAFLSYAREDSFGVVIFFDQALDAAAIQRTTAVLRRLLDAALECGGTYYLCYQRVAEPRQLRRAYPQIDEFFARKRQYDPSGLFHSQFHADYARPTQPHGAVRSGEAPAARRPRLPAAEVFQPVTEDGVTLRLERYRDGRGGAPVVLAAGYSMSAQVFTSPTLRTSLAEYLCERGHDVWLLSWRSSPELAACRTRFSLDDVARFDWPAALEVVRHRSGAAAVDCVAHCMGSQTLLMSLAAGHVEDAVRSALCLQVGLYYDQPLLSRLKMRLRIPEVLDRLGLRYMGQSARGPRGWGYRLLDAALRLYPVSRAQRCANRTCRRSTFIWGELLRHANVDAATHERMADFLGDAAVPAIAQMARAGRIGRIVAAEGQDVYFGAPERLALPITFVRGGANATMLAGSTLRTYELLCRTNGRGFYQHHVVPGYGHMDCLLGRHAPRDVFPLIGDHLERARRGAGPGLPTAPVSRAS